MTGRRMKIVSIRSCDCGQHTRLVLHECGASTHVALRIPGSYRETLEELGLLEGAPDCPD